MIPAALRDRDQAPRRRPLGQEPRCASGGRRCSVRCSRFCSGAVEAETRSSAARASGMSDKTEVLVRGSSASAGRVTAWVAVHAGTPEQRATAHGAEAHAAALTELRKSQLGYDALIAVADPTATSVGRSLCAISRPAMTSSASRGSEVAASVGLGGSGCRPYSMTTSPERRRTRAALSYDALVSAGTRDSARARSRFSGLWASNGLKSWPQTRAQVRSLPSAQLGLLQLPGTSF